MSAEGFARDLARFRARIDPLPHPRVAMIVGGKSKAHDLPPERARGMALEVDAAVRASGGSLLLELHPAHAAGRAPHPDGGPGGPAGLDLGR